jgi:hypothetical protein
MAANTLIYDIIRRGANFLMLEIIVNIIHFVLLLAQSVPLLYLFISYNKRVL